MSLEVSLLILPLGTEPLNGGGTLPGTSSGSKNNRNKLFS